MTTAAASPAAVAVDDLKTLDAGSVKAACSVTIAGKVVIHGVRVIQQPQKAAWVALPSRKAGERYFPVVEISDEKLREQVSNAVLTAWQGWA